MSFVKSGLLVLITSIILFSCQKDSFITSPDASVNFSADTLNYDTVFTSAGSVIQSVKIFNDNNQKLSLSKIKLSGESNSAFKLNIDGTPEYEADNIDIAANDSLYIFVQVNIQPSAANLPFIIRDSILISYNGNDRFIQLQAYGKNAHFLKNTNISSDAIWSNDLPYVILGGFTVDTGVKLTIEKGCRIYSHADAPFLVDGTLQISGTKDEKVIFSGDRLDDDYKDLPASWPGIFLRETSLDNDFKFAVIKNAYQALVVQEPSQNANPKLKLSQSIIDNSYDAGLLGVHTSISADNCLISNCGSNILLGYGGDYHFTHCTVVSYSNLFINHTNPVLQVSDFIEQDGQVNTSDLNAVFTNCIFWGDGGNVIDEIAVNKEGSANAFTVKFDHDLYKAENDPGNITAINIIKNQDPLFDSIDISHNTYNFHFNNNPSSPAINAGISTIYNNDLDDKLRIDGLPDLGCYER